MVRIFHWFIFDTHLWIPECLIEIGQPAPERGTSSHSALRQILSQKTVHLLAFFTLIYIGVEVTIGGSQCFDFVDRFGPEFRR